jgi:hypothetical protein
MKAGVPLKLFSGSVASAGFPSPRRIRAASQWDGLLPDELTDEPRDRAVTECAEGGRRKMWQPLKKYLA